MARIALVTPAGAGTRNGNRHTALRWAAFLRRAGHRVSVALAWDGAPCDLLLALHARRSHDSIAQYRSLHPRGPLAVVLTGTDLYRDLPASAEARRSLELADRLIVLQEEALRRLTPRLRRKTRVVYQSATPGARRAPPAGVFRVAVIGHLREEKDPFRAAAALARLPQEPAIEVVHVGAALSADMAREARRRMRGEPRYRWLGGLPHARALAWLARSHLLVVSSRMEGGANVIAEAARIGTPVLASSVPGNVGMLGRGYPGYFPLGDERALARLMARARREAEFYRRLRRALAARRHLFAPAAERAALARALRSLRRPSGRGSAAARR
ncbi:MAG: selenoneine biosynthesis selenosugar synthase SenB [Burkholderiales bacterium]